ncbi:MAG: hypothetical protein GXO36_01810 [Chloroflexi bacterium]|nr:hypothetical protein [Chloroflexota bacterium]
MRRLFHFITGAGIGLLAGGVLALLFAPTQGDAMRDALRERVRTLWEQIQQAGEEERRRLEAELAALLGMESDRPVDKV